ncbi:MAG: hypothetical protein OXG05_15130 [Gammaproteobacteria bacterium]|nr:hypothetical protein [Gammaproteobacteria bacterium]
MVRYGTSLGEIADMLRLNGFLREFQMCVVRTIRYACLVLSAFLVGCSALIGPDVPPVGSQFDLVGRMRIEAENSILRLDFHVAYDGSSTQIQVWGPMGLNRTKIVLGDEYHTIEDRRGQIVELRRSDRPGEVPPGVWQLGADLGLWFRLLPLGPNQPKVLDSWSLEGIQVVVEESQLIDDEPVCKRMRLVSDVGEVLVLCDRWRLNES